MNLMDAVTQFNAKRNGAFIKIAYHTELPVRSEFKKSGIQVYKKTEMVVRKGIKYSSLKSVKNKVASGYKLMHDLPWGQWSKAFPKLIIEHNNNNYVRLYLTKHHAKSIYYVNNIPYTKEDLIKTGYVQNSYFNKSHDTVLINLNVDNLDMIY